MSKEAMGNSLIGESLRPVPYLQPGYMIPGVLKDVKIRALEARAEEAEELVMVDTLTGVASLRALTKALANRPERRHGLTHEDSLILLDADRFKDVNDTYGHNAGDETLKGIGRILMENIRNTDIVARIGGEEFAAVLLGTNKEDAAVVAEKIRNAVEISHQNGEILTTISCGVGSLTDNFHASKEAADQALYRAKELGRNRVEVDDYSPSSQPVYEQPSLFT